MFIVVKKNLLSISVMQLRSWSAEHPSTSFSSSVEATVVEIKERTRTRIIIAAFILVDGEHFFLLKTRRVCVWLKQVWRGFLLRRREAIHSLVTTLASSAFLSLLSISNRTHLSLCWEFWKVRNSQIRWGPKSLSSSWHNYTAPRKLWGAELCRVLSLDLHS